ncbi:hypothetical protein CEXT_23191 [Caerostris extrusa]|uniref:Uncharacterized protein n=1 Tax=Caerostris extrusa TaxID=172846 RepID=A0AAV4XXC4_CAEEX|nr:hypothetical protein CEXT_23191 [Caerostris extrusa]
MIQETLKDYGNSEYSKLHRAVEKCEGNLPVALAEWETLKERVHHSYHFEKAFAIEFSCEEIEKGHCQSNLIKSSDRSMLSVQSFATFHDDTYAWSSFANFDPNPAIQLWMQDCVRRYHRRSRTDTSLLSNCEEFLECFNAVNLNSLQG